MRLKLPGILAKDAIARPPLPGCGIATATFCLCCCGPLIKHAIGGVKIWRHGLSGYDGHSHQNGKIRRIGKVIYDIPFVGVPLAAHR